MNTHIVTLVHQMSRYVLHDVVNDGLLTDVVGVYSTVLPQNEIVKGAAVHIQPGVKQKERGVIRNVGTDLPLACPVTPMTVRTEHGGTVNAPVSYEVVENTSILSQLEDGHFGSSNFREQCKTCGKTNGMCPGHSGEETLAWPVIPSVFLGDCKSLLSQVCYACSRFVSKSLESKLGQHVSPIYNMDELKRQYAAEKLAYEKMGGKKPQYATLAQRMLAQTNLANMRRTNNARLAEACLKDLKAQAKQRGLANIECEHCGMIQPTYESDSKHIRAKWNMTHNGDQWVPSPLFWECVLEAIADGDKEHYNDNMPSGPLEFIPVSYLSKHLADLLRSREPLLGPSKLSTKQKWLLRVLPFVISPQTRRIAMQRAFTAADVMFIFDGIRREDLWRIGASTLDKHPSNFVWLHLYITSRPIRPAIQHVSGGHSSSVDPQTNQYYSINTSCAKLREVELRIADSAIKKHIQLVGDETLYNYTEDTADLPFHLYLYPGDARFCLYEIDEALGACLSDLQFELSIMYDQRVINDAKPTVHNSGRTGAKNANLASKRRKSSIVDGESGIKKGKKKKATAEDDNVPKRQKRAGAQHTEVSQTIDISKNKVSLLLTPGLSDEEALQYYDIVDVTSLTHLPALTRRAWIQAAMVCIRSIGGSWHPPPSSTQIKATITSGNVIQFAESSLDALWLSTCFKPNPNAPCPLQACTNLPQPAVLKNLQYSGGGGNGGVNLSSKATAAAAKALDESTKSTFDNQISLKHGFVRGELLTGRVNKSFRKVLTTGGRLPPGWIGMSITGCLTITKSVKVTRANKEQLLARMKRARFNSMFHLIPDLGGIESIVTDEGRIITISNFDHVYCKGERLLRRPASQADPTKPAPISVILDEVVDRLTACEESWIAEKEEIYKHFFETYEYALESMLQVGWTVNLYLEEGDEVIIGRPPALQRQNHNAHRVLPIPGFVLSMNLSAMHGYAADTDGDALIGAVMSSPPARAAIHNLMPLDLNLIDGRTQHPIVALQQDCLLGIALMVDENPALDRVEMIRMASNCVSLTDTRMSYVRYGFDPKNTYGDLWPLIVNSNMAHHQKVAPRRKLHECTHAIHLLERLLPSDFCYVRKLKDFTGTAKDIQDLIQRASNGEDISSERNVTIIWRGKWCCGRATHEVVGMTYNSIPDVCWRLYGRHFALDGLSDMGALGYAYTTLRGFSCSVDDLVMGGRADYVKRGKSRIEVMREAHALNKSAIKLYDTAYDMISEYIRMHASNLSTDDVERALAKLQDFGSVMHAKYGTRLTAWFNDRWRSNQVTLLAYYKAKGSDGNAASLASLLGAQSIGASNVGNVGFSPQMRSHTSQRFGELSASSRGFVKRSFTHGLDNVEFHAHAQMARFLVWKSATPEVSGYAEAKTAVNMQSVSVHPDRTVRSGDSEILQLAFGGDGYRATQVKAFRITSQMMKETQKHDAATGGNLVDLLLSLNDRLPQFEFASKQALLKRGLTVWLNVDITNIALFHSSSWQNGGGCPGFLRDQIFSDWCAAILNVFPSYVSTPFDLLLAARMHLLPECHLTPFTNEASPEQIVAFLQDLHDKYLENMASPGEAVGAHGTQCFTQPSTQLLMKQFKMIERGDANGAPVQIAGGLARELAIIGFSESTTGTTRFALDPRWIQNEIQARAMVAHMSCVFLYEWCNWSRAIWIDLATPNDAVGMDNHHSLGGRHVLYEELKYALIREYGTKSSQQLKRHEVLLFRFSEAPEQLRTMTEWLNVIVSDKSTTYVKRREALKRLSTLWSRCLLPSQFGGICGGPRHPNESTAECPYYFYIAFRHAPKSWAHTHHSGDDMEKWLSGYFLPMETLVTELHGNLIVNGYPDVGPLMSIKEPDDDFASHVDDGIELPPVEACWRVIVSSTRMLNILSHPCVIDHYVECSNLREVERVFGRTSTARSGILELARILHEDSGIFVQLNHLMLLIDQMTASRYVLPLTNEGLVQRDRTSIIAKSSFERISKTLVRTAVEGGFDMCDQVVPNVMLNKRLAYIGSGICEVIPPTPLSKKMHVEDFDLVEIDTSKSRLNALASYLTKE